MKSFLRALLVVGMFASLAIGTSGASIVGTSGQVTKIAPPASVLFGALESDTTMQAFDEQQGVTLGSAVSVDITTPGTYDDTSDLTPGTIPAGTRVNSQFVHSDPVDHHSVQLEGTITTDTDILGVAILQASLDNSDFLGALGTLYPTGQFGRRLNLDNQADFVIEQVDKRTLVIHSDVQLHVDQVRVITKANRPPVCSGTASPNLLWPPNHKFRLITIGGVTDPDGDPVTVVITGVTQDEPLNAKGDGNTTPDAQNGPATNQVYVRAERSGLNDGRVYRISYTGDDGHGGTCTGTSLVGVPHDQGGQPIPIDSGFIYNSFGP